MPAPASRLASDGQPHAYIAYTVLCITARLRWVHQSAAWTAAADRTRASAASARGILLLHPGSPAVTMTPSSCTLICMAVGMLVVRQFSKAAQCCAQSLYVNAAAYPRRSPHLPELWAILCDAMLPGNLPLSGARRSERRVGCIEWKLRR